MFNFIKKKLIDNRIQDELLFEYVMEEMESGTVIKGLYAKAIAYSNGDKAKIDSLYMQYRVQSILDYFSTIKINHEELSKNKLFDYIKNGNKNFNLQEKEVRIEKKEQKSSFEIAKEEYLKNYNDRKSEKKEYLNSNNKDTSECEIKLENFLKKEKLIIISKINNLEVITKNHSNPLQLKLKYNGSDWYIDEIISN